MRSHEPLLQVVPWDALWGQAHALAGQACLWTRELDRAERHLRIAYRAFGRIGDETSLAVVELSESQRRAFAKQGSTALTLAARSRATLEVRALDDMAARAQIIEGLALGQALDRQEEAIEAYRRALPVIERYEQWPVYVGALNSLATSLNRLGRFEEARREYARALRRFSADEHRYWAAYLRQGLGETLLAAGRFQEAARAFGRAAHAFRSSGVRPNALLSELFEVESWCRSGDLDRARKRLRLVLDALPQEKGLDGTFDRELHDALAGKTPDYERLAALRRLVFERSGRSRERKMGKA
jgi:tetratricopeptide (TPR) repeat protein